MCLPYLLPQNTENAWVLSRSARILLSPKQAEVLSNRIPQTLSFRLPRLSEEGGQAPRIASQAATRYTQGLAMGVPCLLQGLQTAIETNGDAPSSARRPRRLRRSLRKASFAKGEDNRYALDPTGAYSFKSMLTGLD